MDRRSGSTYWLTSSASTFPWADQPSAFDRASAFLAASVTLLLAGVFAAIPAAGAARFDPIRALRLRVGDVAVRLEGSVSSPWPSRWGLRRRCCP